GPVTASGVPPMERASPGAPASRFGPRLDFFQRLLSARRCLTSQQMTKVEKLLGVQRTPITLREPLKNTPAQNAIIEKMVKRYSISYVPNRAVALFDIVGFSLLTPFEQMMQLNSLSYSL